ncbi:alanine/glycine:cation symporter family protein [Candidatus Zixiibacteriota bacterium]
MIDSILSFASRIDAILWGPWTIVFIASVSVYFTVKSRFFPVRRMGLILRSTFGSLLEKKEEKPRDPAIAYEDEEVIKRRRRGRMTPFQATSTALASTVGMGSIAGIATALSVGGPGAIFWMWLLAFLSMMTKTAEITLAVHYRDIDDQGRIRGGPMYYINRGLGWPFLATLFSLGIFVNSLCSASLLQAHTVGRAFLESYGTSPYLVTGVMTAITAVVVIGGVRRIGRMSESLVPTMSIVYVIAGVILFIVNFRQIPDVFGLIFRSAFAPAPAMGGFAGVAVSQAIQKGMSLGMFSNEAGLGTAPMAHATADTDHPFRQGMWGAFEVFMVTFIICTITSFAVLSTGVLSSGVSGIELVMAAFSSVFPEQLTNVLISFIILTFCLTTQIGFFIYFETAASNVFSARVMKYLKWLYFIPPVLFAGVADVDRLWVFANIAVGVCAIPNLIAVVALRKEIFKLMHDFVDGRHRYATRLIDVSKEYVRKAGP